MNEQFNEYYKFPVLYDVCTKQAGKILKSKKGFYDYDKNIFKLPKLVFEEIKKNYPESYDIINMVGYELK